MSYERCEAIILRRTRFSETSLIVTLFTDRFGRVDAIAKGAKRLKSPLYGHLDLFACEEVVLFHKGRGRLDLLTEAHLCDEFYFLRSRESLFTCGAYLAHFVMTACMERDPHPASYAVIRATLKALSQKQDPVPLLIRATLRLLSDFGFAPLLQNCAVCSNEVVSQMQYVLSGKHGGLVCTSCEGAKQQEILTAEGIAVLQYTQQQRTIHHRLSIRRDTGIQLMQSLMSYAEYVVGKRIHAASRLLDLAGTLNE